MLHDPLGLLVLALAAPAAPATPAAPLAPARAATAPAAATGARPSLQDAAAEGPSPVDGGVDAGVDAGIEEAVGEGDDGGVAEGVPDGAAAVVGGETITMDEYERYLVRVYGRGPLQDLIDHRLLARAARERGVAVSEAEVEQLLERNWQRQLQRVRGDEEAFAVQLARTGLRPDEYREHLRREVRDGLLAAELCRLDREVGDEDVRERFRREYGEDGEKVEVRHVVLVPARERARRIREGADPSELGAAAIERSLRERAEAILAELRSGADFAEVAARESHDVAAKRTGGALPRYDYTSYGEPFAEAVRAAEVGVPVGPVRTAAGFHVIEVTSRVHTELADVRAEIRAELEAEPPDQAELEALRRRLRESVEIRTF